jgi:hypothetical protein
VVPWWLEETGFGVEKEMVRCQKMCSWEISEET